MSAPSRKRAPLLVLGLEAAPPEALREGMASGRLPTLGAFAAAGRACDLHGDAAFLEASFWPSALTGLRVGEHGRAASTAAQGRHAPGVTGGWFWETATEADVLVVDVPGRALDGRSTGGRHIAGWGAHDSTSGALRCSSPELLEEVRRRWPPLPVERGYGGRTKEAPIDGLLHSIAVRGELLRGLVDDRRPDVLVAVFTETHAIGHGAWDAHRAAGPDGTDGLRQALQAIDDQIARLVGCFQDPDVVVLTGAGLWDGWPAFQLLDEALVAMGHRVRRTDGGRPIDVARRVVPSVVRRRLAARLPSRLQHQLVAADASAGTDWARSTAYLLPNAHQGFVRLNVRGREPHGIVEPAAADEVAARISEDLLALRRPDGERAVACVERVRGPRGTLPAALPDLLVLWAPHDDLLRTVHYEDRTIEQDVPAWIGTSAHGPGAMAIAHGPHTEDLLPPSSDFHDLAPRLARLLAGERLG